MPFAISFIIGNFFKTLRKKATGPVHKVCQFEYTDTLEAFLHKSCH